MDPFDCITLSVLRIDHPFGLGQPGGVRGGWSHRILDKRFHCFRGVIQEAPLTQRSFTYSSNIYQIVK